MPDVMSMRHNAKLLEALAALRKEFPQVESIGITFIDKSVLTHRTL